MTAPNTAEIRCTATHDNILIGRAYAHEMSFGAFIEAQPLGAEIASISGRICIWTGRYTMSNGHRAAVLIVTDAAGKARGLDTIEIHTCLSNVWNATGRVYPNPLVISVAATDLEDK